MDRLRALVAGSAADHPWLPRALALGWLGWIWVGFLTIGRPSYFRNPFAAATLIVHEAGHAAFMWLGTRMLTIAGGTIFQLAVPLLVAWMFWRQREFLGVAVALFWLGTSLVDAGVYAADARIQVLQRVSPWGGEDDPTAHDWTNMLMRVGKLSRAEAIGGRIRAAGMMVMPLALLAGAWIVNVLRTAPKPSAPREEGRRLERLSREVR